MALLPSKDADKECKNLTVDFVMFWKESLNSDGQQLHQSKSTKRTISDAWQFWLEYRHIMFFFCSLDIVMSIKCIEVKTWMCYWKKKCNSNGQQCNKPQWHNLLLWETLNSYHH
jgi:hypothetical protein